MLPWPSDTQKSFQSSSILGQNYVLAKDRKKSLASVKHNLGQKNGIPEL